jgi:uncharacterized membrane protein YedE/YeeE
VNSRLSPYLLAVVFGLAVGFVISRIGAADYDEVHRMVTFADARLWLVFAGIVALNMAGFALLVRAGARYPRNLVHRGTVAGGILFGIGWTFTGACPSVVLVQVGEGRIGALISAAGMFLGTWLYGYVHARWFRWNVGSCDF